MPLVALEALEHLSRERAGPVHLAAVLAHDGELSREGQRGARRVHCERERWARGAEHRLLASGGGGGAADVVQQGGGALLHLGPREQRREPREQPRRDKRRGGGRVVRKVDERRERALGARQVLLRPARGRARVVWPGIRRVRAQVLCDLFAFIVFRFLPLFLLFCFLLVVVFVDWVSS